MSICALAGDSDFSEGIQTEFRNTLYDLIKNHGVNLFYMIFGGDFNLMAAEEMKKLINVYPELCYEVFLCNIPYKEYDRFISFYYNITIVDGEDGESREHGLKEMRESIIDASEYVITYVKSIGSDAEDFKSMSEKKGKKIIELNK